MVANMHFLVFFSRVAGHPLAQNERCLHMFLQDESVDKNYTPSKLRQAWTSLDSTHTHKNMAHKQYERFESFLTATESSHEPEGVQNNSKYTLALVLSLHFSAYILFQSFCSDL